MQWYDSLYEGSAMAAAVVVVIVAVVMVIAIVMTIVRVMDNANLIDLTQAHFRLQ